MSNRQTQILEAAVRVIAQHGVRGLRVETLAAEAGVSTALIYYHFQNRAGVLRRALDHINDRAALYTESAFTETDPRAQLEQMLLLEFQNSPKIRENSIAWGELRASAVFADELREPLRTTTQEWADDVESLIRQAQDAGLADPKASPADAARTTHRPGRGSERTLAERLDPIERARELLTGAISVEIDPS